jgi:hypothetical protein
MESEGIKELPIRNRVKYDEARRKLLEILSETTIKPIVPVRPKNVGKNAQGYPTHPTNRGDVIGTIGRTMTMGFGMVKFRGYREFVANANHPVLLRRLVEFGNLCVPKGWAYETITLNEGVKAKKHKDGYNNGDSVIVGIGDYTGGNLKVWDENDENVKTFNIHDRPLMFNGALHYHQTTSFKGTRYTFVFYRQKKHGKVKGVVMRGSGDDQYLSPEEEAEAEGGVIG